MVHWTIAFVAAALIAGILGVSSLAGYATDLAVAAFFLFIMLAVASLRTRL